VWLSIFQPPLVGLFCAELRRTTVPAAALAAPQADSII
jgi:hypothetical protein